nr:leucine-rich repeat protein [Lachnospiraceae bacterium]
KIYTNTILPTEETVVPFVSNWTKNLGDKNPSDVFEVYVKGGNIEEPYVLDGSAVCGGLTEEPEYIDGLQVYELDGAYNLSKLEVPNTQAQDKVDKFNWNDGYYRLTGDTVITTTPDSKTDITRVYANENVVIDLNGHALTFDAIQYQTSKGSSFTITDSKKGGRVTGEIYFWGSGNYYLNGGTINATKSVVKSYGTWMFNMSGGEIVVDGAVINCYHDCESIMMQLFGGMFRMESGEVNYIPAGEVCNHNLEIIFAYSSKIRINGGTMKMEAPEPGCVMSVSGSDVQITGGTFISKYTGTDSNKIKGNRIITTEVIHKAKIAISGGKFITDGDACIDVPYETGSELALDGKVEMTSAKYDLNFYNETVPPVYMESDFDLGRKLKCYTTKAIPTEDNGIVFVKDWVEYRGEEEPKDYLSVYLPDGTTCSPYVLNGDAVCGGVTEEAEVIDGLEVRELQGTYNLSNLEVPNTSRKEEGKDEYYWADGYYRLAGDTTFSTSLINSDSSRSDVYINENVVIDLNGHTLTVDPICFNTVNTSIFTIVDSGENGQLNGPAFMWGSGCFYLYGGTLNLTENLTKKYSNDWVFNLLGGDLLVDGAVVNCNHDSDTIMVQAMGANIDIRSGELNCTPELIHTYHQYLIFAMNSTINISGGKLCLESDGQGYLLDVYESKLNISGGNFIAKSTDKNSKRVEDTRVVSGSLSNHSTIKITGGSFETNGEGCIEVPCGEKDTLTIGGNVEMTSNNYDVYYGQTTVRPITISSDFHLGRVMKIYAKKNIPSEENTVVYVKDWTKTKGDTDPKDVFVVCLPDGTTRQPYILDTAAVCGGVYESETVLNDTGDHTWKGSYDFSDDTLPWGISTTDATLAGSLDRGTYQLSADVTLKDSSRDTGIIRIDKTVEIDLKGHTLHGENIKFSVQEATGKLTIKDSVGGGKVTGYIEIESSNSSELNLLGGNYDLKDPTGKRGCIYANGSLFTAKNVVFDLYDNSNSRTGIHISATSSDMEKCEVNYIGNQKSYAYVNCAVRVKGNATFTDCTLNANNPYGEVTALQKEGGTVKLINCNLTADSNKVVSTYEHRACAVYNGGQYSSGRLEIDGGKLTSNGRCAIYNQDYLVMHNAPTYSCSGKTDILFNTSTNNQGTMEIAKLYRPSSKTRVEFKSKDFNGLSTSPRIFAKNWSSYMKEVSPETIFELVDDGLQLYVNESSLYMGLKESKTQTETTTSEHSETQQNQQQTQTETQQQQTQTETQQQTQTEAKTETQQTQNTAQDEPKQESATQSTNQEASTKTDNKSEKPKTKKNATVASEKNKGVSEEKVNTTKKGNATVVSVKSKKTSITLGATVEYKNVDYKVTTIAKKAFKNCKNLKTLTLPNTVKTIEKYAFTGSKKLKTIKLNIKKSITVEKKAFSGIDSSKITIKVSKKMSTKQLTKFKKELKRAGFKGKVKRNL